MPNQIQILAILCFPLSLRAQTGKLLLTLEEASLRMNRSNPTLQIADKAVGIAQSEQEKMNAFWYPMLNASGMYVHLSDRVEVRQPLDTYTTPAKEFVQTILPNDQLITSLLDRLGSQTLTVPILPVMVTGSIWWLQILAESPGQTGWTMRKVRQMSFPAWWLWMRIRTTLRNFRRN